MPAKILAIMVKYREAAIEVKPLIVMIISEDPSNCIGQGPAQNQLQVRWKVYQLFMLVAIETNDEHVIAFWHTEFYTVIYKASLHPNGELHVSFNILLYFLRTFPKK